MSSDITTQIVKEKEETPTQHPGTSEPESRTEEPVTFKLYKAPTSQAASPSAELPDSYFEPTTTELKAAFNSQRNLSQKLSNAPLKTQAIRESEERSKLRRWPNTTIRIKFPDRTQLEKTFPSTDKIKSVYAFVRNSLREDVKPVKFILYQAPPRREFKVSDAEVRDKSLAQLSLSPSSVLLLNFVEDRYNVPTVRAPLSEDVWKVAQELPPPPTFDAPVRTQEKGDGKQKASGSGAKPGVPKWLKLSKK